MFDHETTNRTIDWYLFFDLLQISCDIIALTKPTDFIILIGDTPSYLLPFLEKQRRVFNLPLSNKPFGCFYPPIYKNYKELGLKDIYNPPRENLIAYFTYLNNHTSLTREFVKENWLRIVLVDSSQGTSIVGVAIFLNRYIGNIAMEDDVVDCTRVDGVKPLQFVNLVDGRFKTATIPMDRIRDYDGVIDNMYPFDFVILIGSSCFYHRVYFLIYESYPRFVEFYSYRRWNKPPVIDKEGVIALHTLDNMLTVYTKINKSDAFSELYLEVLQCCKPVYDGDSSVEAANEFFDGVNLYMLSLKYSIYFKKYVNLINKIIHE